MSRGPGRIQRFILDTLHQQVTERRALSVGGRLWPVPALAAHYARTTNRPDTPHLRSAFRRAANQLGQAGTVKGYDLTLSTRTLSNLGGSSRRRVLCIALSDTDVDQRDVDDAEILMCNAEPPGPLNTLADLRTTAS